MPRLFIAVWPPEEVVAELTTLPRKDQRGVRFVPPENWHVTLRFLGDADPDDVIDALDGVELPGARVRVGPGVDAFDERALVVPVVGLAELAESVIDATRHLGQAPRRRFAGHLTIARVKPTAPMPPVIGAYVSAGFLVDEVALVHSRLYPDGARYETIETWPVGRPAGDAWH
jgi:2'-5' RNA ligase